MALYNRDPRASPSRHPHGARLHATGAPMAHWNRTRAPKWGLPLPWVQELVPGCSEGFLHSLEPPPHTLSRGLAELRGEGQAACEGGRCPLLAGHPYGARLPVAGPAAQGPRGSHTGLPCTACSALRRGLPRCCRHGQARRARRVVPSRVPNAVWPQGGLRRGAEWVSDPVRASARLVAPGPDQAGGRAQRALGSPLLSAMRCKAA